MPMVSKSGWRGGGTRENPTIHAPGVTFLFNKLKLIGEQEA